LGVHFSDVLVNLVASPLELLTSFVERRRRGLFLSSTKDSPHCCAKCRLLEDRQSREGPLETILETQLTIDIFFVLLLRPFRTYEYISFVVSEDFEEEPVESGYKGCHWEGEGDKAAVVPVALDSPDDPIIR
jgi:hypothetical protein